MNKKGVGISQLVTLVLGVGVMAAMFLGVFYLRSGTVGLGEQVQLLGSDFDQTEGNDIIDECPCTTENPTIRRNDVSYCVAPSMTEEQVTSLKNYFSENDYPGLERRIEYLTDSSQAIYVKEACQRAILDNEWPI